MGDGGVRRNYVCSSKTIVESMIDYHPETWSIQYVPSHFYMFF